MLSSVGRCVLLLFGISFALSSLRWSQNPTDKTIAKTLSSLSVLSYLLLLSGVKRGEFFYIDRLSGVCLGLLTPHGLLRSTTACRNRVSGVFRGHSAMHIYFYEQPMCTVHGRLVRGLLLQAH